MVFFILRSRDKKFNSLKKSSSRKSAKEDEGNNVNSLDRKNWSKFLSSTSKQNFVPVPTDRFRSYRRVPQMEKPPLTAQESLQSTDSKYVDSFVVTPGADPEQ